MDSRAQVSILPEHIYKELQNRPRSHKTGIKLTGYDGANIPVTEKCIARIKKGHNKTFQFIVVPTKSVPIMGLDSCEKLNLINKCFIINGTDTSIIDKYDSVFGNIGCLPGEYKIKVDPNVAPVIHPPRRVPFALKHKLTAELERMMEMRIISKVDTPSEWVNSIVLVEKKW